MLKRHLAVFGAFFKNSLIREMQFRSHFWLYVIINFIWAALAMATFKFIFNEISLVGDWTFPAMLLLTANFYLFHRLFQFLFEINFHNFNYLVNSGDLDLVLTKPISGQFFVSFRQISFPHLFVIITMLGVLFWLLKAYFWPVSFVNLIIYGLLFICGLIIIYSFWFMTLTLVFWLGNIDNIEHLFATFFEAGRIPLDVTGLVIRPALTYFLPLAFVATVPVKALIGQVNYGLVIFGVLAAAFWLFVSRLVWRLALRHYSSASS